MPPSWSPGALGTPKHPGSVRTIPGAASARSGATSTTRRSRASATRVSEGGGAHSASVTARCVGTTMPYLLPKAGTRITRAAALLNGRDGRTPSTGSVTTHAPGTSTPESNPRRWMCTDVCATAAARAWSTCSPSIMLIKTARSIGATSASLRGSELTCGPDGTGGRPSSAQRVSTAICPRTVMAGRARMARRRAAAKMDATTIERDA